MHMSPSVQQVYPMADIVIQDTTRTYYVGFNRHTIRPSLPFQRTPLPK